MTEGRFDVSLLNARGLKDEDFWEAQRDGNISALLDKLPVDLHCPAVKNRIMDNMAGFFLNKLFSLGNCAWPYYYETYGVGTALNGICLLTTDSEPTYTEDWGERDPSTHISRMIDTANSTLGAKRFDQDQVSPWEVWADTTGRDAVYFRNRVLYTPSQGISSDIRSVGIAFNDEGTSYGGYNRAIAKIGRVRLKDAGGNPIIINKTASQVLLIEYTFALVSQ